MRYVVIVLTLAVLAPLRTYGALGVADAQITVKVQDDNGRPIEHAHVVVSFNIPKTMNSWDGTKNVEVKGTTDTNGLFSAASSTLRKIHVTAEKQGYYRSSTYYSFKSSEQELLHAEKWQPWNPTLDIRLRKKSKPVPLNAKWLHNVEFPESDNPVGYDLLTGDWVAPHGKGKKSDFTFNLIRDYISPSDYSLTLIIVTARAHDGFFGISDDDVSPQSELFLPRQAPETGYNVTNIVVSQSSSTTKSVGSDWFVRTPQANHFFFRIRTELDDEGQVKKAHYGKLVGPIKFEYHPVIAKTGKLELRYYVNPEPGDRNLEFDPKKNLFKNLEWSEQVKKP